MVGVTALIGAAYAGGDFLGWPPYAAKADVETLQTQVEANTEANLTLELENAFRRGDAVAIRRLCNAIKRQFHYTPAGCT